MRYSIVLQSFGREQEYKRAIFCLLSHFCFAKPEWVEKVILFTDNPGYFESFLTGYPVHYVLLTDEKIKAMRGEINFLHRMKITMIEKSFQLTTGDLLYVDSDTFFTGNPHQAMAEVSPAVSFMHKHEYQFSTLKEMALPAGAPFRTFYKLAMSKGFLISAGHTIKVSPEFSSWNAGAMALHQSHQSLLQDVYSLTDQFFPSTQNHASEQYAFSIILQTKTNLKPLDNIIYHYWYRVKKTIMDEVLAREISDKFLSMNPGQRISQLVSLTKQLPGLLENHIHTLRDNAIQAFHENRFSIGYAYALQAVVKNPTDKKFWLDLGYHTKRWIRKFI